MNTGFEVYAGTAFFIHDAKFDRIGRQSENLFDATKQLVGKCHFGRSVHFWLDQVNRTGTRISIGVILGTFQIVHGDGDSDHRIQDSLENLVAVAIENGRVGHQMADISQK